MIQKKHFSFVLALCLIAIGAAYLCWNIINISSYTVDDAFITLRYAQHLAEQGQLTWNLNAAPVEGYTSFLHMLWLTLGFCCHVPILIWNKVSNVVALAIIAGLFIRQIKQHQQDYAFVLSFACCVSFLLLNNDTAVHAVAGLETLLYTFFLFMFSLQFYWVNTAKVDDSAQKTHLILLAITALLLGLSRPEGNAYAFFLLMATVLRPHNKPFRTKLLLSIGLFYVLPGCLYFVWRWWYYHQLLPLPFYIKMDTQTGWPGLSQVLKYCGYYWPLLVASGLIYVLAFRKYTFLVLSFVLTWFLALVINSKIAPIMDYNFRYTYPCIALFLASAWLLSLLTAGAKKLAMVGLIFLLLCFAQINFKHMQSNIEGVQWYQHGMQAAHIPLGKALAALPDTSVLVISDAGAVPYYSHWKTIDGFGLNNQFLATHRLTAQARANYILDEKPRVIVLISNSVPRFNFVLSYEQNIYLMARQQGMRVLKIYQFAAHTYYLVVMGYPSDRALIKALQ